jgi:hypothetical protein
MTVKELEKYCLDEANKWIGRATKATDEKQAFCVGKATTFMWIAATIQNNVTDDKPQA